MSDQQDVPARMQGMGYTPREAAFLQLVVEHSGYFLPRQFDAFCDRSRGSARVSFVRKLLDRRHGTASGCGRHGQLYHVSARHLYRALSQEDNRNRRTRPAALIRSRLMTLDFVLEHRAYGYLGYGEDRVRYFTQTHGVDVDRLPAKRYVSTKGGAPTLQYFVDKYPAFTTPTPDQTTAVVSFCYIAEDAYGCTGFETYLRQYERLFVALRRFRLVYVCAVDDHDRAHAEAAFGRWRHRAAGGSDDAEGAALASHFQRREWYETGQYRHLTREDLTALRTELSRFRGERYEWLFEAWKRRGVTDVVRADATTTVSVEAGPVFEKCVLPHRYDLFHSTRRWPQLAAAPRNAGA